MERHELRAEIRVPVLQRANLNAGSEWFACMVMDMSNSGLQLLSNRQLEIGHIFEFRCELYPGKSMECMIEIIHSKNDSAGAMITEIDDNSTQLLKSYLEEKLAIKLDKQPPARAPKS